MTAKTFEVETGSASETSNSYESVANADIYNDTYKSNATWTALTTANKQLYLMRATQYLDMKYTRRWRGNRCDEDQALDWPRNFITDYDGYSIDSDEIPQALKDATVEMSIVIAGGENPMENLSDNGTIKKTKKKVGPLEISTEYTDGDVPNKVYQRTEHLLYDLIFPTGEIRRA